MGGRRIDDHAFFAGSPLKGSIFPEGNKVKEFKDGEGVGELMKYEDSAESIKSSQDMAKSKAKSHAQKPYHRN